MIRAGARLLLLGAPACAAVVVQGKTVDGTSKDDVRCLCQNKPWLSHAAGGDDKDQAADGKDKDQAAVIQPAAYNYFKGKDSCLNARALTGGDCRRVDLAVIQEQYKKMCLGSLNYIRTIPMDFTGFGWGKTLDSFVPEAEFWRKPHGWWSMEPLVLRFAKNEGLQKARQAAFDKAWGRDVDQVYGLVKTKVDTVLLGDVEHMYGLWKSICESPEECGEIPLVKAACDRWLEPVKAAAKKEEEDTKAAQDKIEREWAANQEKEEERIRRRHEDNRKRAWKNANDKALSGLGGY